MPTVIKHTWAERMASDTPWTVLHGPTSLAYNKPGTELAMLICGDSGEYRVYKVRKLSSHYFRKKSKPSFGIVIRDASTITEAQAERGERPRIVWEGPSTLAAFLWLAQAIAKKSAR